MLVPMLSLHGGPPVVLAPAPAAIQCQADVQVPEEPAEGVDGVLTVAFRLPTGSRLSRRFSTADSVAVVTAYVAQQMRASGELTAGQRVVLSTQFPKKVLQQLDQQLDAAGVEDRSILTVAVH